MVQPMKLSTTGLPSIMSAQWISEELTKFRKEKRSNICKGLLDRQSVEGEHFLERIFVGDETWIHYYEAASKRQCMEWKHTNSPPTPPKEVQNASNLWKVTLTVFGTHKGYYWNVIKRRVQERTELKPAIRKKRDLLSDGVVLFHDNPVLSLLPTLLKLVKN